MPTHDTRSEILRKVNFTIQLLREAAELLESSPEKRTRRLGVNRYADKAIDRRLMREE